MKKAVLEFLIQYRRTPLPSGYSPSELLNGRQIRALIDAMVPTPTQQIQAMHQKQTRKAQVPKQQKPHKYAVGTPCYALYYGPRRDKDPKWIPAVVTKVYGASSVNVRVLPRGPTWRRHEQLQPRYPSEDDNEPGECTPSTAATMITSHSDRANNADAPADNTARVTGEETTGVKPKIRRPNPRMPTGSEYGAHNPRRSARHQQAK